MAVANAIKKERVLTQPKGNFERLVVTVRIWKSPICISPHCIVARTHATLLVSDPHMLALFPHASWVRGKGHATKAYAVNQRERKYCWENKLKDSVSGHYYWLLVIKYCAPVA